VQAIKKGPQGELSIVGGSQKGGGKKGVKVGGGGKIENADSAAATEKGGGSKEGRGMAWQTFCVLLEKNHRSNKKNPFWRKSARGGGGRAKEIYSVTKEREAQQRGTDFYPENRVHRRRHDRYRRSSPFHKNRKEKGGRAEGRTI